MDVDLEIDGITCCPIMGREYYSMVPNLFDCMQEREGHAHLVIFPYTLHFVMQNDHKLQK